MKKIKRKKEKKLSFSLLYTPESKCPSKQVREALQEFNILMLDFLRNFKADRNTHTYL